ncbi:MAG: exosortase C-terminal domain/associated protein EpsI [Candidatus Thiodiazotropha sp.]
MDSLRIKKAKFHSALPMIVGMVLMGTVYHTTVYSFYHTWVHGSDIYSHGLLLFAVCVYMFYREWNTRAQNLETKFRPLYIFFLVLLSFAWLVAEMVQLQTATQLVFILLLGVFVLAMYGARSNYRMLFPILVLICAIPVWSMLEWPLQIPTAIMVNELLHLTGYVSIRDGYLITIPEGVFEVGNRCSGLRYQVAAVSISMLYGYFMQSRLLHSLIYILTASLMAFVSNVIRIYIVVLAGHYTNMKHELLDDHIWLGWVVFLICFSCLFYVWALVDKKSTESEDSNEDRNVQEKKIQGKLAKSMIVIGVLILSATIGPAVNYAIGAIAASASGEVSKLNFSLDQWKETEYLSAWGPSWQSADIELYKKLAKGDGKKVEIYLAGYGKQEQGKEIINSKNRRFDSGLWKKKVSTKRTLDIDPYNKIVVKEDVIQSGGGERRVVWSWYYVGGRETVSDLKAKLYGILGVFQGRTDATAILISSKMRDEGESRQALKEFVTGNAGLIESQIDTQYLKDSM